MSTELSERIHWIDLGGVNAYLVDDEGTLTLIDAGTPGDEEAITEGVTEAGHEVSEIERVLVTHYDYDHVGALAALSLASGATIHVGESDAGLLEGEESAPWKNHKGAIQRVAGTRVETPDLEVMTVADGDRVGSFTAYHTPGHSPGHTSFVSEALDAGFLGDLVFESDGSLDPSGLAMSYDTDEVKESILDLDERAPEFEVLGMGHGVPFRERGRERLADCAAEI